MQRYQNMNHLAPQIVHLVENCVLTEPTTLPAALLSNHLVSCVEMEPPKTASISGPGDDLPAKSPSHATGSPSEGKTACNHHGTEYCSTNQWMRVQNKLIINSFASVVPHLDPHHLPLFF